MGSWRGSPRMKPRSVQVASGDVVAFWRDRFSYLCDKLTNGPDEEDAWFWRVQWDILNYLLHRYAGEELRSLPGEKRDIPFARVAQGKTFPGDEAQISGQGLRFRGSAKPPRDSVAIRSSLRNIVDGNRERHALLERLRAELRKEKTLQRELNREAIGWMKEYLRIYGMLPEDEKPMAPEQLSEDEIVDMLSELINMDRPPEESDKSPS
jgi:hypothetical protein